MTQVGLFARWIALGAVCGVLCGASSAVFLWSLELATSTRLAASWLVFALPIAGALIGLGYAKWRGPVKEGTSLVIRRQRDGGPEIPVRMAPLVLVGTVLTHLFGGSAGREGTAVQMGASLSDFLAHRLRLDAALRRDLLAAGVAGGFGAVFGTPIAGTIFAMELARPGKLQLRVLVPSAIAAFVGDVVTRGLGIQHTVYPQAPRLELTPSLLADWVVFGVAIWLVGVAFIELSHRLKKIDRPLPVKLFAAGLVVLVLWKLVGSDDYLGLGVPTIVRAFNDPTLPSWAFAAKLLFTAVTVGAGFLGGEVTPLFFIGACLGNLLGQWLGVPLEVAAGVGMAAMFGVCANAPLALAVMAAELLGVSIFPHALLVCVVAALMNQRQWSIYPAQLEPSATGQ